MNHHLLSVSALMGGFALLPLSRPLGQPSARALVTDDRQVTQQQLQCVRDSFATYFHGGTSTTSHSSISPAQVDVDWSNLEAVMDSVVVGRDTIRAVRLHYGLQTSYGQNAYRFSLALEVLRLAPLGNDNWTVLPVSGRFYAVSGTGQLQKTDPATWGEGKTYFDHAFVRRTSNTRTFVAVDPDVDTRMFILPWENEVLALHDENTKCDAVRFVCIAEPGNRNGAVDEDMRHHICAVALDKGTELVNNDPIDPARPYHLKAADVGSPCPSTCADAHLPAQGMKLKNCP